MKTIPAKYMATGSSCWVLTITQAKRAFASPTSCIMLQKRKMIHQNTISATKMTQWIIGPSYSLKAFYLIILQYTLSQLDQLTVKLFRSGKQIYIMYVMFFINSTQSGKIWNRAKAPILAYIGGPYKLQTRGGETHQQTKEQETYLFNQAIYYILLSSSFLSVC